MDVVAQASNRVAFTVVSSGAQIQIVVDPSISRGDFAATIDNRGRLRIRSLDVVIDDPAAIRREFGHFLGVGHVIDDPSKLMYCSSYEFAYASTEEVMHFRMGFLRPPGFDARKG